MYRFNIDEFDDKSKEDLAEVIKEIREQYIINGRLSQFWLLPNSFSNITLSYQVLEKWLRFLSNSSVLHYYKPKNGFDFERDQAVVYGRLGDNYNWGSQMTVPFVSDLTADSFSIYALDIYDTNLDQLLMAVSRKQYFGNINKDVFDHYYYNDIPLTTINNSPILKHLLERFLAADNHSLTPQDVMNVLIEHNSKYDDDLSKRNSCIYKIKTELFNVSQHRVTIESSKCGRAVEFYSLVSSQ